MGFFPGYCVCRVALAICVAAAFAEVPAPVLGLCPSFACCVGVGTAPRRRVVADAWGAEAVLSSGLCTCYVS